MKLKLAIEPDYYLRWERSPTIAGYITLTIMEEDKPLAHLHYSPEATKDMAKKLIAFAEYIEAKKT